MLKTFIFPFLVSMLVATSPAFGDQNSDSTNFSRARFKIPKPRLYDGVYRTPPNVMTRLPAIMVQTSLNFTSQPALDRSGNLYSADLHKNLIEKCGPGGHTEIFSRDSRLKGPTAVVCDDKDNL